MRRLRLLLPIAVLTCTTMAAHAQPQPGPNLTPNGRPFLYAPRAGYLGPPVAMHSARQAPWPLIYRRTGALSIPAGPPPPSPPPPVVRVPELPPPPVAQGRPPVDLPPPPATQVQPPRNKPASGLPRGQRPPVPCPNGCEVDMP